MGVGVEGEASERECCESWRRVLTTQMGLVTTPVQTPMEVAKRSLRSAELMDRDLKGMV
jgi:hypothetical protein